MDQPLINIIIAAKNAQETIEKCIKSVFALDYENYELIVVNDGSQDRTAAILQKYAQKIMILTNAISQGPSLARNLAARQAKGEFIAFTDADCSVDKNWLKELLEGFRQFPAAVACGGRQEIPVDETKFGRHVTRFMQRAGFITDYMRAPKSGIIPVRHNPSCNVIYKREIFLKEGGFLEGLWPGEDVELDYRLTKKGYKLYFNRQAMVYHYRPANLKVFLQMMFRYGLAQGFLVRKYGLFRPLHFLAIFSPVLVVLCIVSLLLNFCLTLALLILFFIVASGYFSSLASLSLFAWLFGFFVSFFRYTKISHGAILQRDNKF